MSRQFWRDAFGWGIVLWLIGYVLGIIFFFVISPTIIGWIIMPIGIIITFWVLLRKVTASGFQYNLQLATVWTAIAIVFDYLFQVKLFQPPDGYYKLDVYLYYALTFISPLVVGWWKESKPRG